MYPPWKFGMNGFFSAETNENTFVWFYCHGKRKRTRVMEKACFEANKCAFSMVKSWSHDLIFQAHKKTFSFDFPNVTQRFGWIFFLAFVICWKFEAKLWSSGLRISGKKFAPVHALCRRFNCNFITYFLNFASNLMQ